jgi:hypothetical protein
MAHLVEKMRTLLLLLLLGPAFASGQLFERGPIHVGTGFYGLPMQDPDGFTRAVKRGDVRAIDRWMKRELMARKEGEQVDNGSTMITVHSLTYNSIVDWLRKQPGVIDAAWDSCVGKLDIWPGHSTIGLRWRVGDEVRERCWRVQEGVQGTINLFGWRPRVRRDRQQLKYRGAADRPGFVQEHRERCERVRP